MSPIYKVLDLKIESYILESVKLASKKVVWSANNVKGLRPLFKDVLPLPTHVRKWTVNRSPFKHKRFRDTFELCTYKRLFSVVAEQSVAENFIKYLEVAMPPAARLKVTQKVYYPLENYYGLDPNLLPKDQTIEEITENLIQTEARNNGIDLAHLEQLEQQARENQFAEPNDQSKLD
jgi:small subunit ribosomal protein S10